MCLLWTFTWKSLIHQNLVNFHSWRFSNVIAFCNSFLSLWQAHRKFLFFEVVQCDMRHTPKLCTYKSQRDIQNWIDVKKNHNDKHYYQPCSNVFNTVYNLLLNSLTQIPFALICVQTQCLYAIMLVHDSTTLYTSTQTHTFALISGEIFILWIFLFETYL